MTVVHLVDGTYELFRHHYGLPEAARGREGTNAAVRGVLFSLLYLLEEGATHVGVATDHVIESFRNDLWPGYKTGAGIDPVLRSQFEPLEEAIEAMGIKCWAMVELEADDALASAAAVCADDPSVEQVVIRTPDKDLGQCVTGQRVVQYDVRKKLAHDEAGIREKFGVDPASIPDYLALVGDSADGFPGIAGWGAKSTAAVLRKYGHIEQIPVEPQHWDVPEVRSGVRLIRSLVDNLHLAVLFKELATLRVDRSLLDTTDDLHWRGPQPEFSALCERLGSPPLAQRAADLAARRA
jgi:5'-3' exonuclease